MKNTHLKTITIDDDIEYNIGHAIRIIEQQKQFDSYSDQWQNLQDQLDQIFQDIGFSLVYDYRQLPF